MKLKYRILEFIAKHKYVTKTLCIYLFPDISTSHIEKTLKKLYDQNLLSRKMIEFEPIRQSREYVYYLTKKGANKFLETSSLFADISEVHFSNGNMVFMNHDLAVSYLAAMWIIQSEPYYGSYFDKVKVESRRNFQCREKVIPDLTITTYKSGKEQSNYFVEVDNLSLSMKEWRRKLVNYRDFFYNDRNPKKYLLIVTTKYHPKRIFKIFKIGENIILRNSFLYGTSMVEIYEYSYPANIWITQRSIQLGLEASTEHLPV